VTTSKGNWAGAAGRWRGGKRGGMQKIIPSILGGLAGAFIYAYIYHKYDIGSEILTTVSIIFLLIYVYILDCRISKK